jgi:zinc protease
VKVPTPAELKAVFDGAAKTPVVAYTENLSGAELVATEPAPGKIVATQTIPAVSVTDWTLSNGAHVMVKPTDFKDDEVLFSASSMGGSSLASDPEFISAAFASQVVSLSGIGAFSAVDLGKKLAGKAAGVGPSIGETSEGLAGHASPKDIETLFQLAYLDFTAPRLDTAAFGAWKNQAAAFFADKGNDPDQVFSDTVGWTMSSHNFRARPLTAAIFSELDPQKSLAFYKDRFADASNFTFLFVGNVDTLTLKPLVEKYLASLPSTHKSETFRDNGGAPPKGIVEKVVRKGVEPKANTLIEFTGACTYAPETRFAFRALVEYFRIKLDETLREKLGGTYSPSFGGGCGRVPRQEYELNVQFNSSPENVELLTKTVFAMIDSLKANQPSAGDVAKVKEQLTRAREVEIKQNEYWRANIMARRQAGEDIAGLLKPYDQMLAGLTAAQIQDAAKKYFDTKNYARFVLLPENAKVNP